MEIKVFGPGCSKCDETENMLKKAVKEAGVNATVEKVKDYGEMMRLGIMATPAVAIDGTVVCKGRVPARAEVMEWLKA